MYLSSMEMSQLSTDDDSFDCGGGDKRRATTMSEQRWRKCRRPPHEAEFPAHLEYAGSVWGPPRIEQIVFSSAHKPFPCSDTNQQGATVTVSNLRGLTVRE